MKLLKAYFEWCNKLTTLYGAFGFALGLATVHFSNGDSERLLIDLAFAASFRVMISLHKEYQA